MPDLITLDLAIPDNAIEEPDGPPTPQIHAAGQPYALTEVDGDPELDPGAPSAADDPQHGCPILREAKGGVKVSASTQADPTQTLPLLHSAVQVHKAHLQDARDIFDLVNSLSGDGTLLRRSYAEICENIRDFTVAETSPEGAAEPRFLGCGALHLYGPHLAEIRSIVLYPEARGQGAGGALLRALLREAEEHGVTSTCLFTRIPDFFTHYGFRTAERTALPDKIYKDCQACPRLYACDEVAMLKGPLPQTAVLGPVKVQQPDLVQVQLHPVTTVHT